MQYIADAMEVKIKSPPKEIDMEDEIKRPLKDVVVTYGGQNDGRKCIHVTVAVKIKM